MHNKNVHTRSEKNRGDDYCNIICGGGYLCDTVFPENEVFRNKKKPQ